MADHLLETLHPGNRADVFKIDRHRGGLAIVLHETEMVVVEAETAPPEGITPGRQKAGSEPIRHRQPIV